MSNNLNPGRLVFINDYYRKRLTYQTTLWLEATIYYHMFLSIICLCKMFERDFVKPTVCVPPIASLR